MKNLVLIILLLGSKFSNAYLFASWDRELDYNKATHIFVVDKAAGAGNLFFTNVLFKAERLKQFFPDRQYVFLYTRDFYDHRDNERIAVHDLHIVEDVMEKVDKAEKLLRLLERFQKIASIDFSTHSTAWDIGYFILRANSPGVVELRDNFIEDQAYVVFHGCNTGYRFAWQMSELWKVPTFGALTGTDFQYQSTLGEWWFNNPGQYPEGTQWKWNRGLRWSQMRPQNAPYRGKWGSYEGGWLGFYKHFCRFEGSDNHCYKAMALNLLASGVSLQSPLKVGEEEYRRQAKEFLCPTRSVGSVKEECFAALNRAEITGERVYTPSPWNGNTAFCHKTHCEVDIVRRDGYLKVIATDNPEPTTMVDEYLAYLKGYKVLMAELEL